MLIGNHLSISSWKSSHFIAFLTLKNWDLLKNAGILRVLKNRELQIREIQGHELQGLPVYLIFEIQFLKILYSVPYFVGFGTLQIWDLYTMLYLPTKVPSMTINE